VNRSELSQESPGSSAASSELPSEAPVSSSERPALLAFFGAELVALVFYMAVSRPMWFYLDEWDFLSNRTAGNLNDLFRAHNEHWVTLPVIVYRAMWWIFGLDSYRPC
jgi:hypothetical protein